MVIQRGGNLDDHLAHEVLFHGDVAADELLHLTTQLTRVEELINLSLALCNTIHAKSFYFQ